MEIVCLEGFGDDKLNMLGEGRSLAGDEGMEKVHEGLGRQGGTSAEHLGSEGSVGAERNGPPACQNNCALYRRSFVNDLTLECSLSCMIPQSHNHAICTGSLAVGQKHLPIEFGWTSPAGSRL